MDKIFNMKIHESITPNISDEDVLIIRVPGGWIYKISEIEQHIMPDGQWSENYKISTTFVPFCNGLI